jgi:hypothetical protein
MGRNIPRLWPKGTWQRPVRDCDGGDGAAPPNAVMPRESGASSTPWLLGSIIDFSGILDRPVKPDDDN